MASSSIISLLNTDNVRGCFPPLKLRPLTSVCKLSPAFNSTFTQVTGDGVWKIVRVIDLSTVVWKKKILKKKMKGFVQYRLSLWTIKNQMEILCLDVFPWFNLMLVWYNNYQTSDMTHYCWSTVIWSDCQT